MIYFDTNNKSFDELLTAIPANNSSSSLIFLKVSLCHSYTFIFGKFYPQVTLLSTENCSLKTVYNLVELLKIFKLSVSEKYLNELHNIVAFFIFCSMLFPNTGGSHKIPYIKLAYLIFTCVQ